MGALFSQTIRDKARAAYLGLAIGDALGATVEFMTPNEIKASYKQHKNIIGGGWLKLKPGRVTDDTEMSLALGNALMLSKKVDAVAIADAFSVWMSSKPVDIGSTVRRGILHYRNHYETSVEKCEHSAGNGACMRTLPVALATLGCEKEDVITASRIQSHITHHSDLSDAGTEHIIELTQMALMGNDIEDLETCSIVFANQHRQFQFKKKAVTNPSGYIVDTIQAVLQAFYSTPSFEACLIDVVNRGGDADTTGAIAGMLAGAYYGLDGIPSRWLKKLDKDVKKLCEFQVERLLEIAPVNVPAT